MKNSYSVRLQVFQLLLLSSIAVAQNDTTVMNPTYLIKGPNCEIIEINPATSPLLEIFSKMNPPSCAPPDFRPLSKIVYNSQRTEAYLVIMTHLFENVSSEHIQCEYVAIKPMNLHNPFARKPIRITETRTQLKASEQSLAVRCGTLDRTLPTYFYFNTHLIFLPTDEVHKKIKESRKAKPKEKYPLPPFGIIVILLDSVSMTSFKRSMPMVEEYMMQTGWFPLYGHHKVRVNTIPNMRVLFTGTSNRTRKVFGDFIRNNYVTVYAEDGSWETFDYETNRTDYFSAFNKFVLEKNLPAEKIRNSVICNGNYSVFDRLMDHVVQFTSTFKGERYFGFFVSCQHTHDETSGPSQLETPLLKYLKKFDRRNLRNDSVVFLIGDHGLRFGPKRMTVEGGREDSMPMFYVSLPEWLKKRHPSIEKALQKNKHRLTSHFDTHLTLKHLIKLNGGTPSYETLKDCPTCQSLFQEVPEDRTCFDANIPLQYCYCDVYKMVSYGQNATNYTSAAQLLIDYMNREISLFGDDVCVKITSPEIVYAWDVHGITVAIFSTNLDYRIFEGAVNLTNKKNPIFKAPQLLNCYNKHMRLCGPKDIYEFCECNANYPQRLNPDYPPPVRDPVLVHKPNDWPPTQLPSGGRRVLSRLFGVLLLMAIVCGTIL